MRDIKKQAEMLNRLMLELFAGNALVDNLTYNLEYLNYSRLAKAIHEPVAHILPLWADEVSDLNSALGGRNVRYAVPEFTQEYKSVQEIFEELDNYFNKLREILLTILDNYEDYDYEIKIFIEKFLNEKVLKFKQQTQEWAIASKRYSPEMFDLKINELTDYLPISLEVDD